MSPITLMVKVLSPSLSFGSISLKVSFVFVASMFSGSQEARPEAGWLNDRQIYEYLHRVHDALHDAVLWRESTSLISLWASLGSVEDNLTSALNLTKSFFSCHQFLFLLFQYELGSICRSAQGSGRYQLRTQSLMSSVILIVLLMANFRHSFKCLQKFLI